MVLPIPVPMDAQDRAVRFISFAGHPASSTAIAAAWPAPMPAGGAARGMAGAAASTLEVEQVGAVEASFVPKPGDFSRLDARFRLPESVGDRLPRYRGFGFVVFKLKAGRTRIHPLAFSFPRADASTLFFPTVHIHEGTVQDHAHFDHALHFQAPLLGAAAEEAWSESALIGRQLEHAGDYPDLIAPDQHLHTRSLRGELANSDVIVPLG